MAGNKILEQQLKRDHAKTMNDIIRKAKEHAELMETKTRRLEDKLQDVTSEGEKQMVLMTSEIRKQSREISALKAQATTSTSNDNLKYDDVGFLCEGAKHIHGCRCRECANSCGCGNSFTIYHLRLGESRRVACPYCNRRWVATR